MFLNVTAGSSLLTLPRFSLGYRGLGAWKPKQKDARHKNNLSTTPGRTLDTVPGKDMVERIMVF